MDIRFRITVVRWCNVHNVFHRKYHAGNAAYMSYMYPAFSCISLNETMPL